MSKLLDFASQFSVKKFSKGTIILHQGEVPRAAYVIKRGIVKSYTISDNGDEKPVTFKIRSEIFPAAWVFGKLSSALYFYEAVSDCECYIVPLDDLRKFIDSNAPAQAELLDNYISVFIGQTLQINALEHSRANEKLLHMLHYLTVRFGKEVSSNTVILQISLTQQELAGLLGLTRETTGMELNKLKAKGIVASSGRQFSIKTDQLAKHMGEAAFEDLRL